MAFNETGHYKNVANLDLLIGYIVSYGATYAPTKTDITLCHPLDTLYQSLDTLYQPLDTLCQSLDTLCQSLDKSYKNQYKSFKKL